MNERTERDWIVHSRIKIGSRTYGGQVTWIAEDAIGVVAMAPTKEELIRLLRDMGVTA